MLRHRALRLAADRRGATVIEYALIAALLSTAIVGGVSTYTASVGGLYDSIVEGLTRK